MPFETDRQGPGRRVEDVKHCEMHETNTKTLNELTSQQSAQVASARTWRLAGAIAGGAMGVIVSFTAWVATDNLSTLRGDIKELKTIVQNSSLSEARYSIQLQQIERRLEQLEEHSPERR